MQVVRAAFVVTVFVCLLLQGPRAHAANQLDFVGIWLTEKGDGAVEFKGCGDLLCGYIHSIFSVPDPSLPLRDNRNEKPLLRKRPLCGLQTFGGLKRVSSDAYGDGWVYDPDTGKSYSVEITLQGSGALSVRGYVGTRLFGKTVQFTRAQTPPKKCTPLSDS